MNKSEFLSEFSKLSATRIPHDAGQRELLVSVIAHAHGRPSACVIGLTGSPPKLEIYFRFSDQLKFVTVNGRPTDKDKTDLIYDFLTDFVKSHPEYLKARGFNNELNKQ